MYTTPALADRTAARQLIPRRALLAAGAIVVAALGLAWALLVADSPFRALLAAVAVVVAAVAVLRPHLAVVAVAVIVYSNVTAIAVNIYGAPGMIALAVPALLGIACFYHVVLRREPLVLPAAVPWLLAFLLVQLVSALFARDTRNAMEFVQTFFVEGLAIVLLVSNSVRDAATLRRVVWALVLTGAWLGALSGFQQLTGTFYTRYLGFAQVGDGAFITASSDGGESIQPRLAGPIGEKNYYGQYMLMLVPLGGYLASTERRRSRRVLAMLATVLVMVGMALTFSRGAALALGVVLLCLVLLRHVRLRHLGYAALGMVVVVILAPGYVDRLGRLASVIGEGEEEDAAIEGRLGENEAAILAFLDHPVLGVGPGQFRQHYSAYASRIGADTHGGTRRAHSLYLSTASEQGVLGVAAFMGAIAVTMRGLLRSRSRTRIRAPEESLLPTAFFLSLVGFLAAAVFLDLAYARYFWLMFGLAAAAGHIALRESPAIRRRFPAAATARAAQA